MSFQYVESISVPITSPVLLSTIHHDIFLKSLPCEFPHCIIHQPLIIYFLIDDLLLSKFIQARHTGGGIWTKNNLFEPCDIVFDGFFKLFLCFHTFLKGYIQLFLQVLTKTSCWFIIIFVSPTQVTKIFLALFLTSKNSLLSSSLDMLHCCFSALVYLHPSTYT